MTFDWEEATIIGRESDRTTRWIREAVKIRQEGQDIMNRDEGVFLLSHVYDDLLLSAATTVATPSGEFSVRRRPKVVVTRRIFSDSKGGSSVKY